MTQHLILSFFKAAIYLLSSTPAVKAAYRPFISIAKGLRPPPMRAWTCHGQTHQEMVQNLLSANIVKSPAIKEAMMKVDRSHYVSEKRESYIDAPQSIGHGQTISAPHMHAHALEELLPTLIRHQSSGVNDGDGGNGLKILDVGSGSGYLTACLGRLVEPGKNMLGLSGRVYGIEYLPKLVDWSLSNISKGDSDLLKSKTISVEQGDGWRGFPSEAPFHAIHVGAAAETYPKALLMQLVVGGILICPVGPQGDTQYLYKIERINDQSKQSPSIFNPADFQFEQLFGVRYVPLVGENYDF